MTTSRASLAEGPVNRHLVSLTVPMIWGILAMMAFNVTDTWFVAQLGSRELAAMSFTFPVVMVLISLGIGLMAGTSSVIARSIGSGEQRRVRRLTSDALILSTLLSLVLTLAGLLSIDPLFRLLGAPDDLLPPIRDYMQVWYGGFICFLVPMAGLGAIRATGDSKLQSRIMITAALANLVLDPLLIFGLAGFPRLEIQGAAIATIIARFLTLFIGFWALHFKFRMFSFTLPTPSILWSSWQSVLHVGLPAAGTNVIIPVSTGVIVAMIAQFGPSAVAGFGVATRVEGVSLVVFYAMSAIIGPFVGQNLGAGRCERILEALQRGTIFCLVFGLGVALVLAVSAGPLSRLFSSDSEVLSVSRLYLLLVPISYGAAGIVMFVNAAFNGIGRPFPAVAISVIRTFVLYVPTAYLGGHYLGVPGIFLAACLSNLLCGLWAYAWLRRVCRHIAKPRQTPSPDDDRVSDMAKP